ncbi:D-gluconate kinase [Escherichia coli]|uniref:gluconokinase n=1 Tax=Escherichia coli TaxID=562 RepID=A0A2X1J9N3_ECOLX|nr:D-gluconate kinase [Escherichia coli]
MSQGIPLSDEDRLPWLERLNDASYSLYKKNETGFIVCSSLKKQYRDILRKGSPHVHFLWLDGDYETILARMQRRGWAFYAGSVTKKVSLRHWSVHKKMNRILCALISTMILPMSPNNVGRLCWRYDKTEYVRKRQRLRSALRMIFKNRLSTPRGNAALPSRTCWMASLIFDIGNNSVVGRNLAAAGKTHQLTQLIRRASSRARDTAIARN